MFSFSCLHPCITLHTHQSISIVLYKLRYYIILYDISHFLQFILSVIKCSIILFVQQGNSLSSLKVPGRFPSTCRNKPLDIHTIDFSAVYIIQKPFYESFKDKSIFNRAPKTNMNHVCLQFSRRSLHVSHIVSTRIAYVGDVLF